MIEIKDKKDCCGCNACGDICAHGAITFQTDLEGFLYPDIDKDKCIDCGLCEKVCPVIHFEELKKNDFEKPEAVVANHKNIEIRFDSTSGGMFTAYAEWGLKKGYYIGGVIWTDNFSAINYISNNRDDLLKLRNTKYIQSDAQGFYKRIRDLLNDGEKVMVCNLPCQIAALKSYLRKDYEDLLTIDLFCRGVNSPMVFRKFLDSLEAQYDSKIVYIKPKSKDLGWHNLTLKIVFANGKTYYGTKDTDFFTRAFLDSNCITRPSCYKCKFKGFPRVADLSIGDFWHTTDVIDKATALDDNLGTSAVLVNSYKGKTLMKDVSKKLKTEEESLDIIVAGNPALINSIGKEKVDRKLFYEKIRNEDFIKVLDCLFPKHITVRQKIRNTLKAIIRQIKIYARFHPKPIFQFVYYNFFCKEVKNTSITENRILYFTSNCDLEISKGGVLEVNGRCTIGTSVFKKSDRQSRIRIMSGGKLVFDGNRDFGDGLNIEVFSTGELTIKKGSWTNVNFTIICMDKILIDEWAMIGRDVTIRDNNGGHPVGIYGSRTHLPVIIGKHAWLTSNCMIMMGVRIGDGAIIGSNTLVNTSIPSNCIANGIPAVVSQTNILWRM